MWRLRVEHDRAVLLGHDLGPARMNHRQRLERPQESSWRARVRARERGAWEIEQNAACAVPESPEAHALERRLDLGRLYARPARDVSQRCRTETTQVTARQVLG